MTLRKYSKNFYNLIMGRSVRNIADSIYFIALSVGLVNIYNIEAGQLSIFTLVGLIPNLMSFLYGSILNQLKNSKIWLVFFQLFQLIIISFTIYCLSIHIDVRVMYLLNFLFSLSTNMLNTIQMKIIPDTLDNDEEVINKSIDIQYFTSNILDIISNFTATILLGILSYISLFNISIPFFVMAIYFMLKLKLPSDSAESVEDSEAEPEDESKLLATLSAFKESKFASFIVIMESFLSGGTDLLLTLIPLYLISEGISIKYFGLVLAVQRFSDLLGSLLAPKIKISYKSFFYLDYIISGLSLIFVFIIPSPMIKLILFSLSFIIIGISGNMFEKMIYSEYDYSKMGLIYSTNSSLYAFFAIVFLIIPQFYTNIKVIGIVINFMTFLAGIYLIITKKTMEDAPSEISSKK